MCKDIDGGKIEEEMILEVVPPVKFDLKQAYPNRIVVGKRVKVRWVYESGALEVIDNPLLEDYNGIPETMSVLIGESSCFRIVR